MRFFALLSLGCLLLVAPALADMYQDGSNAKTPDALNNLAAGGGVVIWAPGSDTHLEINKAGTPPGEAYTETYPGPTAAFQTLRTHNLGTDKSSIDYLFKSQVAGDGDVSGVPSGGASRSFWNTVMAIMNKDGDGSAASFTFADHLTSSKPGDTGYNEITGIMGTAMNAGSPNGYASGVEVVVGDTADYVNHFKTGLHAVIGRVHKRDTTYPSSDTKNSNSFMAASEGTVPVGSMFYGYAQPGSPGWYVGIDLHDATITSGMAVRLRNNTNIGWMAADAVTDVPALQMGADNNFYVGRGAAQTVVFRPVAEVGSPATTEVKAPVNVTLCRGGAPGTAPANTAENILMTCTLPAGAMGANGQLKVWTTFGTSGAGATVVRLRYNGIAGQKMVEYGLTGGGNVQLEGEVVNLAATNSQITTGRYTGAAGSGISPGNAGVAVDTNAATTAVVATCQKASSGDACILYGWRVELIADGS